ncbi:prepilin-type N-terminal cleavage/methylation domain-containing protein [Chengkuizengella sediminis]|uniref:prepilin-type N-terminal cleavage/methylation domain-containing protein n=1 Tax=Chengkuizengella sediminis TaxID=1885917 RepID=UPI001389F71F|nr:prepilin-type N-terminal cleavage/methylation domain-containing protein [Chengkuizengella sediminis]NDI35409.1 prepilin-type N-terminal cleavage/methylation domain-containing protein [Chengkuizengella sediminis]
MGNNEKGFTLIEMLAAIALISIIATLGIMFYTSSHLFWERSVENYSNDADAELTMAAISKYVTDTVKVFYVKNDDKNISEIRIKTGEGSNDIVYLYKSFYLEHDTKTLTLYDIDLSEEDDFVNLNDLSYKNGLVLASKVENIELKTLQQEVASGTLFENGDLIEFIFEFSHTTKRTMIKLFDV